MSFFEGIVTAGLAVSGWVYSSYVSVSASKRSEVRDLCNQIEELLKDCYGIANQLWNEGSIEPAMAEAQGAQLTFLLEMKLISLKEHTNRSFFRIEDLANLQYELTNLSGTTVTSDENTLAKAKRIHLQHIWGDCADILESSEKCYKDLYSSGWKKVISQNKDIFLGITSAMILLLTYGWAVRFF